MKKSKLFTLEFKDYFKGLVVSIIAAVGTLLGQVIQAAIENHATLIIDWSLVGTVALGAALSYLTKNFGTNNKDEILLKNK